MTGLLSLLDDVAGIAKIAAASVDDVIGQATRAGVKTAGAAIDDAAVTPKYLKGFGPARELPIVWRIARGSLRNKVLILLPAALLLSEFAPWSITPLLMLGGVYLCFEGAEKVVHAVLPHGAAPKTATPPPQDPKHLEQERVAGAIKTDFILSAEIMTIALATIAPETGFATRLAILAVVAVGVTALVYGGVAAIVKADDLGLLMAARGRLEATRRLGLGIVKAMPVVLAALTLIGTAAMLWVGGGIVTHGLEEFGLGGLAHAIHDPAEEIGGAAGWVAAATLNGIFGLILGLAVVLSAEKLEPLAARFRSG